MSQLLLETADRRQEVYFNAYFKIEKIKKKKKMSSSQVYIHLGERAFLGMKAKSSKGKNSFGPMIPNPFVRFA